MRVWDVQPGYLSCDSLLSEFRELHGLASVLSNGKRSDVQHPEALRWVGYGWAIKQRQKELVCEMDLRGYEHRPLVRTRSNKGVWPPLFIDEPHIQYEMLKREYTNKKKGLIALPDSTQKLWSQHKYSVLARNQTIYKDIGRRVSSNAVSFEALSMELVELLRTCPAEGGVRNAVQHMWGYVSDIENSNRIGNTASWSLKKMLTLTQENARISKDSYLTNSTALSELMVWL